MIAFRRPGWNFALQRAVDLCREHGKPLIVLEALRVGYRWASHRIHAFVIDGMRANGPAFKRPGVRYYPYLEPESNAGAGLLERLSEKAVAVVTDDFPCFFLPTMVKLAARQLACRLDAVDSNGILPTRLTERVYERAYDFRRHVQRELRPWLADPPEADPLARMPNVKPPTLDAEIVRRWPEAIDSELGPDTRRLGTLPIDPGVSVAPDFIGGHVEAKRRLERFLRQSLDLYPEERNDPDVERTSGLSPYLHFGHISAHEMLSAMIARESWSADRLAVKPNGSRDGFWNASPGFEAFVDQLVTWRELGFNMSTLRPDFDRYESLPNWAKATLQRHAADPRSRVYSAEEFEAAATHDPVWNAAQRQIVREGIMHNYLRMLWGKKILEWSPSPESAAETMIHLNNKYGLDGRNPNSYSGIFWTLGRYDRPWAPERPIFGTIRYMSSENTVRKLKLKRYLERYGSDSAGRLFG
jgi:deoxyribodipyrimidine photo-lyase